MGYAKKFEKNFMMTDTLLQKLKIHILHRKKARHF